MTVCKYVYKYSMRECVYIVRVCVCVCVRACVLYVCVCFSFYTTDAVFIRLNLKLLSTMASIH